MLPVQHTPGILEAGLDEAGRGCLAGPVVAAAVILPEDFDHPGLNDSKKLSHQQRLALRPVICEHAISWAVGILSHARIDEVNILRASFLAMHEAVAGLHILPEGLAVDGNRFLKHALPHVCIVKGDGRYQNIAAASILAKTYRDDIMEMLGRDFPQYNWAQNKGYPTREHKLAIRDHGLSPYHRRSFNHAIQLEIFNTPK
jgi:ribonuclease HII